MVTTNSTLRHAASRRWRRFRWRCGSPARRPGEALDGVAVDLIAAARRDWANDFVTGYRHHHGMARSDAGLPPDYRQVLDHLQRQVRSSRAAAFLAVNAEMLQLYRTIGLTLLERQRRGGGGGGLLAPPHARPRGAFPPH